MYQKVAIGGLLGASVIYGAFKKFMEEGQKTNNKKIFVGIQFGLINYSVAIANAICNNNEQIVDFNILKRKNGKTDKDPEQLIGQIILFIKSYQNMSTVNIKQEFATIDFIGIASFGQLCLNKASHLYGTIITTIKQQWRGYGLLKAFKKAFPNIEIKIDSDVNAITWAEYRLGKHAIKESLAFITVGSTVGVGIVYNGKIAHGLASTEGGHIVVERSPMQSENFRGVCSNHRDRLCLEGMVCNKAIADRLGVSHTALIDIGQQSKVWKIVAFYLAQLCLNICLLLSPQIIVISGGITNRKILLKLIHEEFIRLLAGHVENPLLKHPKISEYIVCTSMQGTDFGVKGALALCSTQS